MSTPEEEIKDLESFFAEDLAAERELLHLPLRDWVKDAMHTREDERSEQAEADYHEQQEQKREQNKKDIFHIPEKPGPQPNWLSNRLTAKDLENAAPKTPGKPGRKKGSINRKTHVVKATQAAIQVMSATGVSEAVMAKMLGKTTKQLRDKFSHELEYGKEILTTRIVNALVQKALDGNVPAMTLYLKAQAGWKEQDKDNLPDDNQLRISEVERTQRLMAMLISNPELLQSIRRKRLEAAPVSETVVDVEEVEDVFDI